MSNTDLIMKSAALARAARREWEEFLTEFSKYSSAQKDLLVHSPADTMARAQGMARQASVLEELFRTAVAQADKIQTRTHSRPTTK